MRRDLYERDPWVADLNALPCMVPWLVAELEDTARRFGPDPWRYGFAANRPEMEQLYRYIVEQGMMEVSCPLDVFFAPNTLAAFKV